MTAPDHFRAQCRLLRIATLVVLSGLTLLLVHSFIFRSTAPLPDVDISRVILWKLAPILPGLGYLWALWAVQGALADLAAGRLFQPTVARAIRQIGIGVLTGALLHVFVVGNLLRVLMEGRGGYLTFDLSAIVLGVVGAALILMARLVDQARTLQAELDEMF